MRRGQLSELGRLVCRKIRSCGGVLGIREFTQGLKKESGSLHSLRSVPLKEGVGTDGGTQQIEIAVQDDFEIWGEGTGVESGTRAAGRNDLAFTSISCTELETNDNTCLPKSFYSL